MQPKRFRHPKVIVKLDYASSLYSITVFRFAVNDNYYKLVTNTKRQPITGTAFPFILILPTPRTKSN
ncbi:hypothetical protein SDC9_186834 [bioreactor metagenome]|uniref:Uncharacterized protein n=1 Tax=bioreactor metagenome TaxID=1076179 RepID=A0A645HL25_9ZZZZ